MQYIYIYYIYNIYIHWISLVMPCYAFFLFLQDLLRMRSEVSSLDEKVRFE
jgi:hypothetical protein